MTKILSTKKETLIKEIINTLNNEGIKNIPMEKILSQAKARNLSGNDTRYILKRLMYKGEIFEPKVGVVCKL